MLPLPRQRLISALLCVAALALGQAKLVQKICLACICPALSFYNWSSYYTLAVIALGQAVTQAKRP